MLRQLDLLLSSHDWLSSYSQIFRQFYVEINDDDSNRIRGLLITRLDLI
jgi:hypothetical protein